MIKKWHDAKRQSDHEALRQMKAQDKNLYLNLNMSDLHSYLINY